MFLVLSLTACGDREPVKATKPPPELLTCAGQPVAPVLPPPGIERDRIVSEWVLAYHAAWGDCSAKLQGIRAWSEALPD